MFIINDILLIYIYIYCHIFSSLSKKSIAIWDFMSVCPLLSAILWVSCIVYFSLLEIGFIGIMLKDLEYLEISKIMMDIPLQWPRKWWKMNGNTLPWSSSVWKINVKIRMNSDSLCQSSPCQSELFSAAATRCLRRRLLGLRLCSCLCSWG